MSTTLRAREWALNLIDEGKDWPDYIEEARAMFYVVEVNHIPSNEHLEIASRLHKFELINEADWCYFNRGAKYIFTTEEQAIIFRLSMSNL